ncbi:DNRLRE domain-containing protein, partial [Cellulomonas sp. APG4]|uniref:DNRLRE domain-containing protein n=1 Tax=Cellulomonas sp. APG4 TaxID=1538656 RepID=UPI00137A8209
MVGVTGFAPVAPSAVDRAVAEPEVETQPEELTAPDGFSASANARSSGRRVEDLSQRTETQSVYAMPDGTWQAAMATGPVWVRLGGDGTAPEDWAQADATLGGAPGGRLAPVAHVADMTLSGGERAGSDGVSVVAEVTDPTTGIATELTWPGDLPDPEVAGPRATYRDVEPGIDMVLEVTGTGVEQFFVLRARPSSAEATALELPIGLASKTGAAEQTEDGGVRILAPDETEAVSVAAPMMWDATHDAQLAAPIAEDWTPSGLGLWANEPVGADLAGTVSQQDDVAQGPGRSELVPTEVSTDGGQADLVMTPGDFLTDPSTTYPVVVDPSVNLTVSFDTFVASDISADNSTGVDLRIGTYNGGASKNRSFLNISTGAIQGRQVLSAELRLWQYHSWSCTAREWQVWEAGNASTATRWGSQPSWKKKWYSVTDTRGYSSSCADGWSAVNITGLARFWADHSATSHGIGLRAASETDNYGWKRFNSGNASSAKPTVVVSYNSYPSTPRTSSYGAGQWAWYPSSTATDKVLYVKTVRPNMQAVVADPDGGNVRALFDVIPSGTSTPVWNKVMGARVTSGSVSFMTANTSIAALTDGKTYTARSWASDDSLTSLASQSMGSFVVDVSAPAMPTVTSTAYATGQWYDPAPASNTFTFSSSADVVRYEYSLDGGAWKSLAASGTPPKATLSWAPKTGSHRLEVRAVDKAGWVSSTRAFTFGTGGPRLTSPAAELKSTDVFTVTASAPAPSTGTVTPTVYWRASGGAEPANFDDVKGSTTGWTAATTLPAVQVGGSTAVSYRWSAAAAAASLGKERVPLMLDVQVCYAYSSPASTRCTWTASDGQATVVRVPHAFGDSFPVAEAGPGQVALWTGEFNTSTTDVSVPGYVGDLSVSRVYSSLAGTEESVFGPGWRASFDGTDIGVAGWEVVDNTTVDGTLALVDEEGSALLYRQPGTGRVHLKTGTYTPADAITAEAGARLNVTGSGAGTVVTFTEDDGTVTRFSPIAYQAGQPTEFAPTAVVEPGAAGQTTFTRDAQGRITRILAPVPPGVTCPSTGALVPGCRAIHVTYATTTTAGTNSGDIAGQVSRIEYEAFDPQRAGGAGMARVSVAEYRYHSTKRLYQVTDPRTGLAVTYHYSGTSSSGQPLLTGVTPSGQARFTLAYGTAPVDAKALVTVDRAAAESGGPAVRLARFVYGIDPSAQPAALPSFAQASTWGQEQVPAYGAAVFGADRPGVAGSAPGSVTSADWPYADLQYTDDQGRVVNTAAFGAGAWQLTSTRYDTAGRVTHELDQGAIAQLRALDGPADAATINSYATITRYNADVTAKETITHDGGSIAQGAVLTPAGTLVTDVWSPAREVTRPDGSVDLVRTHTHTTYDENAPNDGVNPRTGLAFRLPTTVTVTEADPLSGSADPEVPVAEGEPVVAVSSSGYSPIDTAGELDPTSGWMLGAATRTTTGSGGDAITSTTRYDADGRVVESRQPSSADGGDPATTYTAYYTAGAQADENAVCGNAPQWAGLTCRTWHGVDPGHPDVLLPDERTAEYSMYLAASVRTETLGDVVRTSTTEFDAAGRVVASHTQLVGLEGSTPVPATRTEYDPATGQVTATVSVGPDGAEAGRISTAYDLWGRQVTYTDTDGQVTTTAFDAAGRVAQVTDPTGTVSYTYDGAGERRGLVTSQTMSGAGTFTASYDAAGNIVSQSLPGGLTQTATFGRAGEESALAYQGLVEGEPVELVGWSLGRDAQGRIVSVEGPAPDGGSRAQQFAFDAAARLVGVRDSSGGVCRTGQYTFDVNGNRLSHAVQVREVDCAGQVLESASRAWEYDGADRVLARSDVAGEYSYDALGRQLLVPGADTLAGVAGGDLVVGYFDTDAAASLSQGGVSTTYALDPAGRRRTSQTTGGDGGPV